MTYNVFGWTLNLTLSLSLSLSVKMSLGLRMLQLQKNPDTDGQRWSCQLRLEFGMGHVSMFNLVDQLRLSAKYQPGSYC